MKKPARYSPARIFSIWVPEEVSARVNGSRRSRSAQPSVLASVKAWVTVKPKELSGSRTVILSWNMSGSASAMSARSAMPVGASRISSVL